MTSTRNAQYNAYSTATQTVPKTKQIVMLYDGAIRFMKQARIAIEEKRIEDRFHLLNRTSEIVVNLQACLDFENGGDIAQILYDYYSSLDARILNIHRSGDVELCDSIIDNLKEMRGAWGNIDSSMRGDAEGSMDDNNTSATSSTAGTASQPNGRDGQFSAAAHAPMADNMASVLVSA